MRTERKTSLRTAFWQKPIAQRTQAIGSNINSQLKKKKSKTNDFSGFPWLLMSQQMLQVLLSCLSEELMQFEVTEGLVSVNHLRGRSHRKCSSTVLLKL